MFRNILIPVDFSKYSERAAQEAVKQFSDSEHFHFFYVLPLYYGDIWDFSSSENVSKIREDAERRLK
ncbi:MAG: universal stress protein, partial [Thermoplasmata archaeon]